MPEVTQPMTKATLLEKLKDVSELKGWLLVEDHEDGTADDIVANYNSSKSDSSGETFDEKANLHFILPEPYDARQLERFEDTLIALQTRTDLATSPPVELEITVESLIGLHKEIHEDYVHYLDQLARLSRIDGLVLLGLHDPNEEEDPTLYIKIPLNSDGLKLDKLVSLLRKSRIPCELDEDGSAHILKIKPEALNYLEKFSEVYNQPDELLKAVEEFTGIQWKEDFRSEASNFGLATADHLSTQEQARLESLFSYKLGVTLKHINNDGEEVLWLEFDDAQRICDEVQQKQRTLQYEGRVAKVPKRAVNDN